METPPQYSGIILKGNYSQKLKEELIKSITIYTEFDKRNLSMPYVAAWYKSEKDNLWYEFMSDKVIRMLNCSYKDIADMFKASVLEYRRILKTDEMLQEQVMYKEALQDQRPTIRKESENARYHEALYKIKIGNDKYIWLKDRAMIKKYSKDNIYLSFGNLTPISNEVNIKDLMEKLGYYDELTQFPKKKIILNLIQSHINEYDEAQKNNIKIDFSVIMVNLDNFKQINDKYGYTVGDYVLKNFAESIMDIKNMGNEIGRLGGGQFLIIINDNLHTANRVTNIIIEKMKHLHTMYNQEDIKLNISIGSAAFSEINNLTQKAVLDLANKRLLKQY